MGKIGLRSEKVSPDQRVSHGKYSLIIRVPLKTGFTVYIYAYKSHENRAFCARTRSSPPPAPPVSPAPSPPPLVSVPPDAAAASPSPLADMLCCTVVVSDLTVPPSVEVSDITVLVTTVLDTWLLDTTVDDCSLKHDTQNLVYFFVIFLFAEIEEKLFLARFFCFKFHAHIFFSKDQQLVTITHIVYQTLYSNFHNRAYPFSSQ